MRKPHLFPLILLFKEDMKLQGCKSFQSIKPLRKQLHKRQTFRTDSLYGTLRLECIFSISENENYLKISIKYVLPLNK